MKLFLTAAAVICALSGCAGKTEASRDQTQAVSEAKIGKAEEAGREAGKLEDAGKAEEVKEAETSGNGDLSAYLISEASTGVPFTSLTWTSFEKIENEYGAQAKLVEAFDKAEYSEQIRAMAEIGTNPIYIVFDTIDEVAVGPVPEYPEIMFCLIGSNLDTKCNNAANVYVDSLEPAFVSSFVTAKTAQSGTIGRIGGLDTPVINRFRDTHLAGVRYADPDVMVQTAYVGDNSDAVKVGGQTEVMINQGANIIFQTANLAGLDVIQGCSDAGIKCIGMDEWQDGTDDCVSWSSLTDINGAVFDSFTAYKEGRFTAGKTNYGIETQSAIYDDRDYGKFSDDAKAELDELLAAVRSGSPNLEDLLR